MEPIDPQTIDPDETYTVRFGRTQVFESDDGGATFEDLGEDSATRELEMTGRQLLQWRAGEGQFTPRDERVLVDDDGGITVRESIVPPDELAA
jgi:streptomycin 6-kinase